MSFFSLALGSSFNQIRLRAACSNLHSHFKGSSEIVRRLSALSRIMVEYEEKQNRTYEDAVRALNTLQTNAATLEKIKLERRQGIRKGRSKIEEMLMFFERLDLKVEDIDALNVIHVSGSKGKGSVCAFAESIIRHQGNIKTGFYSSPHLLEVRERIRINGVPITQQLFGEYFFRVWDKLVKTKDDYDVAMPAYFRFLTLLGFYVFVQEKVDCAVIEVGIGGLTDCTNISKNPIVCGIASIGLEHQNVLGSKLEDIALHKAGIMKTACPAFTVPQLPVASKVIKDYADEVKASVAVVPNLNKYSNQLPVLGLDGKHQYNNASLAMQLCRTWLLSVENKGSHKEESIKLMNGTDSQNGIPNDINIPPTAEPFEIPQSFLTGLEQTKWPGRNQLLHYDRATVYLDGAHTPDSLNACASWFVNRQRHEGMHLRENVYRILLFNVTGNRDPYLLLPSLSEIGFDAALFCPSVIDSSASNNNDISNFTVTREKQLRWCQLNCSAWRDMQLPKNDEVSSHKQKDLKCEVLSCVSEAIDWLKTIDDGINDSALQRHPGMKDAAHIEVLVTGSIHLIGAVMKYLNVDPLMCH